VLRRSFVVAIDGPAGSGKGTIGKALAKHFGWKFLDTGLLYRAVAQKIISFQGSWCEDEAIRVAMNLSESELDHPDLRTPEVSKLASKVAAIQEVREALLDWQRDFVFDCDGAVLDGRDIASVVVPDAEVKLFLTASPEKRAERRHRELVAQGKTVELNHVLDELILRDQRDITRLSSPLVKTKDAIKIDTTTKSIQESLAVAINMVEKRLKGS